MPSQLYWFVNPFVEGELQNRLSMLLTLLMAPFVGCGGVGSHNAHEGIEASKQPPSVQTTAGALKTSTTSPAAEGARASKPEDYRTVANWACHPDRPDSFCEAPDLRTTIVKADGSLERETVEESGDSAPVDCFYVYPTISLEKSGNASMQLPPSAKLIFANQVDRFRKYCRIYAPIYRQQTQAALMARHGVGSSVGQPNVALGFDDVRSAWQAYLKYFNRGRGVVIVGHSQGARALADMMRHEVDGQPAQAQLVSALLVGAPIKVPKGQLKGGTFTSIPLCRSDSDTGCVITFNADRAGAGEENQFMESDGTAETACTNPAALQGGKGFLDPVMTTFPVFAPFSGDWKPWVKGKTLDTPYVRLPGFVSSECVSVSKGSYLALTVNASPDSPRSDELPGNLVIDGKVRPKWGLHLIEMNVTMGNLVEIVGRQSKAYLATHGAHG